MRTKTFLMCLIAALAVAILVQRWTDVRPVQAASPSNMYQLDVANRSPVQRDIITAAGIVGTSPLLAISNASSTSTHSYYRYHFTNTATAKNVCFFYTTAAVDCTSLSTRTCTEGTVQGTLIVTDGFVVMPGAPVEQVVDGSRRICVVASASSTTYHIDRTTVE